ncbi:MAG: DEAD/DEAH box helicase [Bacteroidetes bacterium]|nr:MAG: DEAD/DEAH box helicase [Bacteroidota bacterium]PTM10586.1 MAG: DEAD/DEAH box helicase [Bacteroidota bacterium]
MDFSELNLSTQLLDALHEMGLQTPTPIQERAFSVIMAGSDVVGIAQTGTGKTLAFLLPVLRLWKFQKHRFPQTLIVVPTRELVVQIVEEVEKLTTHMNVVVAGVYGGVNMRVHKAVVESGLDVLVGTPGRILDLALHGPLKFKALKHLIIDEVDEMLELGFRTQLNNIITLLPEKRQNLLFSATMTPEVEAVIDKTFNFPTTIEAAATGTPLENITQLGYRVQNFNTKINLLRHLLQDRETYHRTLVFAPSKRLADVVFEQITADFPDEISVIHGNKSQNYRFESLRKFQESEHRVLIATDLVSRGLDLTEVSHVINIDTPDLPENYIHRIGRTGRADKTGTSITFTTEEELPFLEAAEELMQYRLEQLPFPEEVYVSEELIVEEMPELRVANVQVKLDTTVPGAFHEKKKKNTKVKMTRRELTEHRNRSKVGRRKSWDPSKKKKRKR